VVQDKSARAESARRPLLFGGIAAACLLGAGLGLWARPGAHERPGAPPVQPTVPAARPDRRLAIVVDDAPAPVGKPLEVLAPARPPMQAPAPPPPAAEPVAPARPPNGLVRVVAPVPGPLAPAPSSKPTPSPSAPARLAAPIAKAAKPPTPPAAAPKPKPARPTAVETANLQKATLKAKPDKRRSREAKVAEAASPAKSRHGLGAIAHAFAKLTPHHAAPQATQRAEASRPAPRRKPPETRLAKAEPRRAKPETSAPVRLAKAKPDVAAPIRVAKAKPEVAAPIRVANVQARCASPDPGEALACGDPGLGAAERRLNRAYREAQDAGVPAATLERQQQRWRAARAAAAREAPWAVRDVYQARIAELQDLARSARGD
jgi:uncharacterized protein YecT (DUF1311 family)